VRVIGGGQVGVPILSFTAEGYDPAELALLLEQLAGIEARAGYHCAGLVHEHLATAAGGTLRVSFGPYNTEEDVAILVDTMDQLLQTSLSSSVAGASGSDLSSRSIPPWQK
jgi:selenocysteine lyase/cysteine desulfurase